MRDYPNGITWNKEGDEFGKPGGRVKVLTDTDGDGRYDKASIFLDEIPFPTGVKVWRKGILVTAAPEIFYAEDTDGDDKADERKSSIAALAKATSSTASTASAGASTTGSTSATATAAA